MNGSDYLGILRHVLTAAGGALVTNGILTGGQLQDAVGAVVVLVGIGFSLYNKMNQRHALAAASLATKQ